MTSAPETFALVGRLSDPGAAESAAAAIAHLKQRGIRTIVEDDANARAFAPDATPVPAAEIAERADIVLSIGGDGTLLYAARLVADRGVPLLGINRGRLGFLTDVLPRDLVGAIDAVLAGECTVDERPLLSALLTNADGSTRRRRALNDVVLQKIETGRMLDFETRIDGKYVNTHGGDGIVIASATGSTAYALSCGGPIIEPHLDVMVVVPVCPHTLSDRPFVVSRRSTIEVRLLDRPGARALATVDGTVLGEVSPGDRLSVGPSPHSIRLLHPKGYDYYRLLRSKLRWGRGEDHTR